jgi:hypothetical protein
MAERPFELSILGGAIEQRYRRLRPDVDRLPWKSLDPAKLPPDLVVRGQRFWTRCTFTEYRAAVGAAATVEALLMARAPVDLVAVGSRFILEELAHVEIAARLAGVLGGSAPLVYDAESLRPKAQSTDALIRALELVIRVFCVGESFSLAMAQVKGRGEEERLIGAALGRIKKDEAAHGRFGWIVLDWADELIDAGARTHLAGVAATALADLERNYEVEQPSGDDRTLGWVPASLFQRVWRDVIDDEIRAPLAARGLMPDR